MQMQLEIDDQLAQRAADRAKAVGSTLDQLVSGFLADFVRRNELAHELDLLSREP